MNYLLAAGLLFPIISILTGIASWWEFKDHQAHSSPVFIPLVGPILLSCWIVLAGLPIWLIPVVWILDLGTVAFAVSAPRIMKDIWQTSRFTRHITLRGSQGIETAVLTLHAGGHYLLRKSWHRPAGECGIASLGEPGRYAEAGSDYELTAHHGVRRILRPVDNQSGQRSFQVIEEPTQKNVAPDASLDGWILNLTD